MSIRGSILGNIAAFAFIKSLVTPWEKTEAFKAGLIDENGKKLKKDTQGILSYHTKIVFNLKRLLEKIPLIGSKLGTYATALFLLKEKYEFTEESEALLEAFVKEHEAEIIALAESTDDIESEVNQMILNEDVATNSISSGDVAQRDIPAAPNCTPDSMFAGHAVFNVDQDTYARCRNSKLKYKRWDKFIDKNSELSGRVKGFAQKNPKTSILFKSKIGTLQFIKNVTGIGQI